MGAFGDIGEGFGKSGSGFMQFGRGIAERRRARQAYEQQRKEREAQLEAMQKIDYTPKYETDLIDPYKGTQSPAARAFLQSFMTGDNPLMGNASMEMPSTQQERQRGFDQRFGAWDKLLERDAAARAETYDTKSPGKVTNWIEGYEMPEAAPNKGIWQKMFG